MKIIECEQRSDLWFSSRLGRLTASSLGDAFATTKSGFSTSRRNLRLRLVLERLTGKSQESGYTNAAMERGILLEPEARAAYEAESGLLVDTVGFIIHDELLTGASPDGLIGEDGGIEIKCPGAAAHLDYIRGETPSDYRLQIAHCLWLTGRAWWDFASYNPDFPEPLRLIVRRFKAHKDFDMAAHELAVRLFLSEVDTELREVESLMVGV